MFVSYVYIIVNVELSMHIQMQFVFPLQQYVLAKVNPALARLGWEDTGNHLSK